VDQSWSWSFCFGPKDQTGPDFQALMSSYMGFFLPFTGQEVSPDGVFGKDLGALLTCQRVMSSEEDTKFYSWSNSLFEIWCLDDAPLVRLLFFVILLI